MNRTGVRSLFKPKDIRQTQPNLRCTSFLFSLLCTIAIGRPQRAAGAFLKASFPFSDKPVVPFLLKIFALSGAIHLLLESKCFLQVSFLEKVMLTP